MVLRHIMDLLSFSTNQLDLTCDGAGDGLSATVSIAQGTNIDHVASTSGASLGKVYSR